MKILPGCFKITCSILPNILTPQKRVFLIQDVSIFLNITSHFQYQWKFPNITWAAWKCICIVYDSPGSVRPARRALPWWSGAGTPNGSMGPSDGPMCHNWLKVLPGRQSGRGPGRSIDAAWRPESRLLTHWLVGGSGNFGARANNLCRDHAVPVHRFLQTRALTVTVSHGHGGSGPQGPALEHGRQWSLGLCPPRRHLSPSRMVHHSFVCKTVGCSGRQQPRPWPRQDGLRP